MTDSTQFISGRTLRETSTAFHLMVDEGPGIILPKRALGDTTRRQEIYTFVAERIGSSG